MLFDTVNYTKIGEEQTLVSNDRVHFLLIMHAFYSKRTHSISPRHVLLTMHTKHAPQCCDVQVRDKVVSKCLGSVSYCNGSVSYCNGVTVDQMMKMSKLRHALMHERKERSDQDTSAKNVGTPDADHRGVPQRRLRVTSLPSSESPQRRLRVPCQLLGALVRVTPLIRVSAPRRGVIARIFELCQPCANHVLWRHHTTRLYFFFCAHM